MENLPQTIGTKEVEARVIELRGQKVILDRDVAELYQTETREINKAVKNNPEKFPDGYCFTLQPSEKQYVVENFHRMERLKKSTVEPRAFTERVFINLINQPVWTSISSEKTQENSGVY